MTDAIVDGSCITVDVDAAYDKGTLVMWSSGTTYTKASAATNVGKNILGHLTKSTQAAGKATVRMLDAPGVHCGIAGGAISAGDLVTAAANGKVESAGAGSYVGVALETVTSGESVQYRRQFCANRA